MREMRARDKSLVPRVHELLISLRMKRSVCYYRFNSVFG